jgi:predicted aspartyl protease
MPLLNAQYGGQGKTPDGRQIFLAPPQALWQRGPCVQVTIELADQVAQELLKRKEPLPHPVSGFALIDTGSMLSCIDEEAAKSMNLPVVGICNMASASHAAHKAPQYPIKIKIPGFHIACNIPSAIGAPLKIQGLVAIIGRDLLQICCLIYNGSTGQITLCV